MGESVGEEPRHGQWIGVVAVVAMATHPFLALVLSNVGQALPVASIVAWWAVTVLAALGVLGVVRLAAPDLVNWAAAALAVFLWCLFNLPLATAVRPQPAMSMPPAIWWGLCSAVVLAATLPAVRHWAAQRFVLLMAVLLVASAVVTGVVEAGRSTSILTATAPDDGHAFVIKPNVWFIALDGLASNDFVGGLGFYDPSAHERRMTALGVESQPDAESNYPLTHLSLSATLMGEYGYEGRTEPTTGPFVAQMRGANTMVGHVRANGYSYAHAHPDLWTANQCAGLEDLCIGSDGAVSEVDLAMQRITPLAPLYVGRPSPTTIAENNDPAALVQRIVDAGLAEPRFSFVHVLHPHPPLLRAADCTVRDVALELSAWGDGPEYSDAVECLHHQVERAVETILSQDDDPMIIIQGDHGPRLGIDWDRPGGVLLDDDMHFSIYSAIRLPSDCSDIRVPDDLTSVNTLRIARSCLTGQAVEMVADHRFPIRAER